MASWFPVGDKIYAPMIGCLILCFLRCMTLTSFIFAISRGLTKSVEHGLRWVNAGSSNHHMAAMYVAFCWYTSCNIDLRKQDHFARLSHILYTCSPWQYSHTIQERVHYENEITSFFILRIFFGMNINLVTKLTFPNKTTLWGFEYSQRMTLIKLCFNPYARYFNLWRKKGARFGSPTTTPTGWNQNLLQVVSNGGSYFHK